MDINKKVEQIFTYLLSVKSMNDKKIREISEYEEIFFENAFHDMEGIDLVNSETKDYWLEITKENKDLYNKFSKIYLKLQKNGENLEIVYGNGLVIGMEEEKQICHPIFITKMTLVFDEKSSVFYLKPYNNVTNVETDFLNGIDKFPIDKLIDLSSKIKTLGINPRVPEELINGINEVSSVLDINFNGEMKKLSSLLDMNSTGSLEFYDEPVIIFRKVDTRLWNLELNSMIEAIKSGYKIPKTIEALVNSEVTNENVKDDEWDVIGEDLLFPLPYNNEQKEIVKRLSENFGVVVQGPPGTGKSHTIVNLICHLLAHGKRVLVTSQTDRALKVLNNKIPEEIRSLCMSILGDDAKAMDDLDNSVRKITENLSLDVSEIKKEFKYLRFKLKECKAAQNSLYEELKKIEESENSLLDYDNNQYTLMDMAKYIRENTNLDYIDDSLCIKDSSPLNDEELMDMLELLEKFKSDELKLYEDSKENINKLPNLDYVLKLIEIYNEENKKAEENKKILSNWSDKEITSYKNTHLINLLDEAYKSLSEIEGTYIEKLMKVYHANKTTKEFWNSFIEHCNECIECISKLKIELNKHAIEIPNNIDLVQFKKDFKIVEKAIREKGKISSLFKMLHGNVKYIIEDVKVDGENVTSVDKLDIVNNYIKLNETEKELKNYFNNNIKELDGEQIEEESNYLLKMEDTLQKLNIVISWDENYKDKIIGLLKAKHFSKEINFYEKEDYKYIKDSLLSLKSFRLMESTREELNQNNKIIKKYPCFNQLCEYIEKFDYKSVKELNREILYVTKNSNELDKLIKYRDKMVDVCPKFTKYIFAKDNENLKNDFMNFKDAFKYRVFSEFIKDNCNNDIMKLEKMLHDEKVLENTLIKEIVSKQSWYNQIQRTTESQKRSLFAWMEAIKRIGKGTGVQAAKYRKIAQKEMEKCKDVIPVWIMPINRVIENLKVNENAFDVVIVDESSQSDITALTALMRAERAVIVGDEKQISPEAIGKDSGMVEKLIEDYLYDIPDSDWFDLKTSLYTTALRVFPNRLVLKEHFRSVEEIIGFSNKTCYSDEIIPLRCGKNDNPIDTEPLIAVKVDDAVREPSRSVNIKEAYAIVDQIEKCCKDEKYNGMTMGVISLLGDAQAEVIENLLIERIGMEEIIERKIVCGDAYSFQGDERDIVFLSLVIANNVKYNILAKDSDIRRFNVAASRARNQMWIFHSVDLEEISPKCIRYKLLDYCINYKNYVYNDIKDKEYVLTDFEEDIEQNLIGESLNITPKVRVGKYEIDFVLDADKCIAIECVGGRRNGKYSWEDSYERQHTLERVGWKFYKIRSSEFYLNSNDSINKLKDFLK